MRLAARTAGGMRSGRWLSASRKPFRLSRIASELEQNMDRERDVRAR
jgi:hypothetical protein